MNPLKDISEAVTAALRNVGARGRPAHPSVHYYRKKARVVCFGGPPSTVVEDALAAFVENGTLKSFEVIRYDQWTCGKTHGSATEAWLKHEGRDHVVHVEDTSCELGCDHGEDFIKADALIKLVEAEETFRSAECVPLVWPEDYPNAVTK